ncbi:MAG: cob(I)yrinic acid a,c-diamide adenosyltransferase [Endomicrobium sp.]|jgi:cob(I)alamin adenosyltransferase|nr:cob(I)yrinic acid a,c-diamide adenosyltransferase [Endomicrobium sp.]
MIIINTGDGKGKSTAAIGQIIRYLGHGFKICLIYLFKKQNCCGEQSILTRFTNLSIFYFAHQHPYFNNKLQTIDVIAQCHLAMLLLEKLIVSEKIYDVIVLDEFNIALNDKFINEEYFITIIQLLSKKSDIIITGRGAPKKLLSIADLVTEMIEKKHPYSSGILAKRGIEF